MKTIEHERGVAFNETLVAVERDQTVVDLTGYSIQSQVRTAGGDLVGNVSIPGPLDNSGEFVASVDDTSGWPLGSVYMDVQYDSPDGIRVSSETIEIIVKEET